MGWGSYKTEHAGAKNGGGHRGSREEAKHMAKRARRAQDLFEVRECLACGGRHGNLPCPYLTVT